MIGDAPFRRVWFEHHPQICRVYDGTNILFTEEDVVEGTFTIDRYCASGDTIELGSAVSSEFKVTLRNRDGKFDDVNFEGMELKVQVKMADWVDKSGIKNSVTWIQMGFFSVDEVVRKGDTIELSALDSMVRFDYPIREDDFTFPTTLHELVENCCTICRVVPRTIPNTLINYDYVVDGFPDEMDTPTYRDIIRMCSALMGTCAMVDTEGYLTLLWKNGAGFDLLPANRYSSDMRNDDIVITGLKWNDVVVGTSDYTIDLSENWMVTEDNAAALLGSLSSIIGTTYRPFNATCKPMPYLVPFDVINYVDADGVSHPSFVTNWHFMLNSSTVISAVGLNTKNDGHAVSSGFTALQQKTLADIRRNIRDTDARVLATDELNEIMRHSLGMYKTTTPERITYYHNHPSLNDSTLVYMFGTGGVAWTNHWEGDDTVWQYGITSEGNAILNTLSVAELNADNIKAGTLKSRNGDFSLNLNTGLLETKNIGIYSDKFVLFSSSGVLETRGANFGLPSNPTSEEDDTRSSVTFYGGKPIKIGDEWQAHVTCMMNSPNIDLHSEERDFVMSVPDAGTIQGYDLKLISSLPLNIDCDAKVNGSITVGGHNSPVGSVIYSATNSGTQTITPGNVAAVSSITLGAGVWVVRGVIRYSASTSGGGVRVTGAITSTTTDKSMHCADYIPPLSGGGLYQMSFVSILNVSANNSVFYLVAGCGSGKGLNGLNLTDAVVTKGNCWQTGLIAVRIA